jgi:hypothetical protein
MITGMRMVNWNSDDEKVLSIRIVRSSPWRLFLLVTLITSFERRKWSAASVMQTVSGRLTGRILDQSKWTFEYFLYLSLLLPVLFVLFLFFSFFYNFTNFFRFLSFEMLVLWGPSLRNFATSGFFSSFVSNCAHSNFIVRHTSIHVLLWLWKQNLRKSKELQANYGFLLDFLKCYR